METVSSRRCGMHLLNWKSFLIYSPKYFLPHAIFSKVIYPKVTQVENRLAPKHRLNKQNARNPCGSSSHSLSNKDTITKCWTVDTHSVCVLRPSLSRGEGHTCHTVPILVKSGAPHKVNTPCAQNTVLCHFVSLCQMP